MMGMPRGVCLALLLAGCSALIPQGPAIRAVRPRDAQARLRVRLENAPSLNPNIRTGLPPKFQRLADDESMRVMSSDVKAAIDLVEQDFKILDKVAGGKVQITWPELGLLGSGALTCLISPAIFPGKVVEILVPTIAATSAAIGFSSEYVGRTAMSRGRETAACTTQAAAECQIQVANAERIKSVVPFCAGVGVSSVACALIMPALIENVFVHHGWKIGKWALCVFPFLATATAAQAAIATKAMTKICREVVNTGERGYTDNMLAAARPAALVVESRRDRIKLFLEHTLPGPLIAFLTPVPGHLPMELFAFKCLMWTAIAGFQSGYSLVVSEYELSRAVDSLSLKARAAAVSEAYANQGSRSASILPFTSSLGGLCAAASAAAVEFLPYIEEAGVLATPLCCLAAGIFPVAGAFFAASASVAKARSEVDAAAAKKASEDFGESTTNGLSEPFGRGLLDPLQGLSEMIKLSVKASVKKLQYRSGRILNIFGDKDKEVSLAPA